MTDELVHYGKKGMKWGVRNNSVRSASSKSSEKSHLTKKEAKDQFRKEAGAIAAVGVLALYGAHRLGKAILGPAYSPKDLFISKKVINSF